MNESDSLKFWNSLFDKSKIDETFKTEKCNELRSLYFLFKVFQAEYLKIQNSLTEKIQSIEKLLEDKNECEKKFSSSPLMEKNCIQKEVNDKHADKFNKENNKQEEPGSPTLNKNRKLLKLKRQSPPMHSKPKNLVTELSFATPTNQNKVLDKIKNTKGSLNPVQIIKGVSPISDDILESSIIDVTPEPKLLKRRKNRIVSSRWNNLKKSSFSSSGMKSSTLTQMFADTNPSSSRTNSFFKSNVLTSTKNDDFLTIGTEDILKGNNKHSSLENTLTKDFEKEKSTSSVATFKISEFFEKNEEKTPDTVQKKTAKYKISKNFVDNYDNIKEKKTSPVHHVVRGKERKKLKGWSCKDCEKFYELMNLPEDELEKRMDECSKHRGKYKIEDTFPGFWDISIPPTPEDQKFAESNASTVFNIY